MRRLRSALLSFSNFSTINFLTAKLLTIILCILICSTLSFAAAPDRITGAIDSSQMIELARSLHPKAQPQYDQGVIDPQFKFGYVTLLTSPSASQQRALDKLMADQQNPSSPNYHKWLSPEQYADRFGLSQNDVNKITTWLQAQGFTVINVGGGRNSIVFSGTAIQVETAFQTQIHRYSIGAKEHFANATAVKIPAAWSGVVTGVRGLNSFRWKPMGIKNRMHPNYYDNNFTPPEFIAPGDIATIYDINPLYNDSPAIDGTGQKLAIIGQTDIYLADINDFRSGFGLSTIPTTGSNPCTINSSGLVVSPCNTTNFAYVLVTADPGTTYSCFDLSEADNDIEWSGATARNAQIVYVNSPATYDSNCNQTNSAGVEDALSAAINPPKGPPIAPVISTSYGLCEQLATDDETELQQGNVEGVTILNAAGDTGAAGCDNFTNSDNNLALYGLAVGYPASSQYVTGVGGSEVPYTDFTSTYWGTANGTNGGSALPPPAPRVPEEAWNDDYESGAYCVANPTNQPDQFCYGINSQLTAQEVIGIGASGGGMSNCFTETAQGVCTGGFPQPTYQQGLSVPGAPAGVQYRYVPDVSLLASDLWPGYIYCTELSELGLTGTGSSCAPGGAAGITNALALEYPSITGGTSVSTPIFAGIVTLLNQYFQGAASTGLGNINPMLYKLAQTESNNYFHQLTTGNNQEYCEVGQPSNQTVEPWLVCPASGIFGFDASNFDTKLGTGYNLVTGLGSVDANNLVVAWASATTSFTLTPTTGAFTVAPGVTAGPDTITVTSTSGFVTNGQTAKPLTYSCLGLPSEATCVFTPPSPTSSATVMVSITTMAPTAQLRAPIGRGNRIFYAMLLPALFGIALTAGSKKRAARGVRLLSFIVVLGFSTMWLASCGGSSSGSSGNPGTPAGFYPITINATTGIVQGTAATVNLTVS
jgi:subtilase family serine protease